VTQRITATLTVPDRYGDAIEDSIRRLAAGYAHDVTIERRETADARDDWRRDNPQEPPDA
jgi:hypothetical protein